jgi:hypothetical protein
MLIDEHQSALEVIMTKYREQITLLSTAKQITQTSYTQSAAFSRHQASATVRQTMLRNNITN